MKCKTLKLDVRPIAEKLLPKWLKDIRKGGGCIGHYELNVGDENNAEVIIETNLGLWLADQMTSDLSKIEYVKVIGTTQCPGSFDWASDTYIKDAVCIHFSMNATF